MIETFAKKRIGFRVTSAVRRDISTSHCDSCGFDSLPPATATSRGSVRSRGRAIAKAGVNIYAGTVSPSIARETINWID